MKKTFLYTALGLMGIMGALSIGVANASIYSVIRPNPSIGNTVTITYNANGGVFSGDLTIKTMTYTKDANGLYMANEKTYAPNKASDNMAAQSGWMFDGWYTTPTNQTTEWYGVAADTTASMEVYAKWLPFNDLKLDFGDAEYTIMDRNLGAEAPAEGIYNEGTPESLEKLGKYYQWGNNYGFDNSTSIWPYTDTNRVENTTSNSWGPGNYYSSATFIKRSGTPYRWDGTNNNPLNGALLWGSETSNESPRQGPCPEGYHIPIQIEWQRIYTAFTNWKNGEGSGFCNDYSSDSKCFAAKLKLPFAGHRTATTSKLEGQGSAGYYPFSRRVDENFAEIFRLGISDSDTSYTTSVRAGGSSIRCLKIPPTQTLTFNASENGGITQATTLSVKKGVPVTLSKSNYPASKTNYTFIGWNTDKNAITALSSIILKEDIMIYAIFKKTITAEYTSENAIISGALTSDTCTMYNNDTSCSITLPSITCNAGYHTPVWSPANLNGITSSQSATASCTACENGTYTTEGNIATSCTICEAGYYCPSGIKTQCPNGYTSDAGASAENECYETLTTTFNKNGAISVSSGSITCKKYYGSDDCSITTPTITPANGFEALGFNTNANATGSDISQNTSLNITGGEVYYAITRSSSPIQITFDANNNGGSYSPVSCYRYNGSGSCSVTSPVITPADGFTVIGWSTDTGNHTNEWTGGTAKTISSNTTYYAQSSKSFSQITVTFDVNGNSGTTANEVCTPATVYNGAEGGSCEITSPDITPAEGFTTIGWNTSATTHESELPVNTAKTVSENATYYAQSSKSFNQITITFDVNGNNGTTANEVCTPATVYNGAEGGSCEITSPAITPANGFTVIGWSTDVGNHTNECTGGTAKTVSSYTTYYAQSEKAGYTVTASYNVGTGVSAYSNTPNTCNVEKVYNGADYTACNITLPDITLQQGYNAGVWSTGNITKNPTEEITLTADETYTATATPNTNTQYLVNYYQEDLNGNYILHETYTGHGTTDTQAIATGDDKTYDGFTFSGTHTSNVTSGNIAGNGSLTLKLYYTRNNYTLTFDANSGSAVNPITAKYQSGIILPGSTRTGYTFTGWKDENDDKFYSGDTYTLLGNATITGQWMANTYVVTYDVNGGKALTSNTGIVTYDATYGTLPTPTRDGYSFNGWFTSATSGSKITSSTVVSSTGDYTLYAQWTQNQPSGGSSGGGGGGGGGGSTKKTTTTTTTTTTGSVTTGTNETNIKSDTQDSSDKTSEGEEDSSLTKEGDREAVEDLKYSEEFTNAYEFAHSKGITTMPTIQQANMEGGLTRIAMAKMLSYYAINVLGQKPDETRNNKFNDISEKLDSQYDNGVSLAYQLGIMGINMPKNNFRPNDEVTRAEFTTALSRMIYKIADGKDVYYSTHLAKLQEEKIITNADPMMIELRGYVMIMLMRSAGK